MKKNKLVWLAAAVLGVAGAAVWMQTQDGAGASAPAATSGAGAQAPVVVNVVTALRQDVPVVLQANGTVTPLATVELHAQSTSVVSRVHIAEGQFVTAGQLMLSLDDRNERANVEKAQAQVVRAQAALADLERQAKRSAELFAQKFIAQGPLETLRSQVEGARAALGADQAALQSARVLASYAAIHAPMAGRVGAINVYPGSLVQLSTPLTSVTRLDPIRVAFTLPESSLSDLLAAYKAGPVAVEVWRGDDAKPISGQLSFVDNSVDPVAGAIRVKAQFDNKDTRLWPGQYVNTRITVRTLKDAVVVPQAAIVSNTRGVFVYTMEADQSAKQRPVVRLHAFGLQAAVSGLSGGEQVIVDGKQNVRPGGQVRLAAAPGRGTSARKGAAQ